jgi:hypothetical protein
MITVEFAQDDAARAAAPPGNRHRGGRIVGGRAFPTRLWVSR